MPLTKWRIKMYEHENKYVMDFALLGFNDWSDLEIDGFLSWGNSTEDVGIYLFLHKDRYEIQYATQNEINWKASDYAELFVTDSMDELWSIVRSNLQYFDSLLIQEV
tara:strand:+ start:1312 stop:1632 length:321 start_codon:yes stop_codon:yes gene_type:complete